MLAWLPFVLGGCATTQLPPQDAIEVPASRIVSRPTAGDATVTVVRDQGFLGGGCYYLLAFNNLQVARMDVGERIEFPVPAGDLLLSVSSDPRGQALCSLRPNHVVQREFTIKAGETKRFRIVIGGGGMDIMRSSF
jgi:hypothetical protein